MKTKYLLATFLLSNSICLWAAVGDTILHNQVRYIVSEEDAANNRYEANLNLIFEQELAEIPATVRHKGQEYKSRPSTACSMIGEGCIPLSDT